jgi:hypothetical protein
MRQNAGMGRGRPWRLRRRAGVLAAAVAGAGLLAAACGGGGGSSPGGSAASPGPETYQQMAAYSQCMQAHGAPGFPEPVKGPGGAYLYPMDPQLAQKLTGPGYNAALRACKKLQPSFVITPAERQAALNQLLKFARCMRAHGITNFPDPTAHGGGVGISLGPGDDPNSPQFQAAQKICQPAAGMKGPGL